MARLISMGAEEGSNSAWADLATLNASYNKTRVVDCNGDLGIWPRTGEFMYEVPWYGSVVNAGNGFFTVGQPDAGQNEIYMGFAFYTTATAASTQRLKVATWATPNTSLELVSNTLALYNGNTQKATTPIVANRWYYVEVHFKATNSAADVFQVKLDGTLLINYAADCTDAASVGSVLFGPGGSGVSWTVYTWMYFDDIVINDTTGGVNDSWPGQVRLYPLKMKGLGATNEFSRGGVDLGANASQVRLRGNALSWLQDTVAGHLNTIGIDAPTLPPGAVVTNLIVEAHACAAAGTAGIIPVVVANGTSDDGATYTVGTSWEAVQEAWPLNPDTGLAWTDADFPTLEIGLKVA